MARTPRNNGKEWSSSDIKKLKNLARQNTDTDLIAKKLERTINSIYNKASEKNISLKPKDK